MNWNIPEAVWPIPAGRVKERPWWWCRSMTQDPEESTHTLYFMQRRDGAQVPVTLDWHYAGQRIDALSEQVTAGLLPHLEAYDLEHPRPRPPYRAGQVWGGCQRQYVADLGSSGRKTRVVCTRFLVVDPYGPCHSQRRPPLRSPRPQRRALVARMNARIRKKLERAWPMTQALLRLDAALRKVTSPWDLDAAAHAYQHSLPKALRSAFLWNAYGRRSLGTFGATRGDYSLNFDLSTQNPEKQIPVGADLALSGAWVHLVYLNVGNTCPALTVQEVEHSGPVRTLISNAVVPALDTAYGRDPRGFWFAFVAGTSAVRVRIDYDVPFTAAVILSGTKCAPQVLPRLPLFTGVSL